MPQIVHADMLPGNRQNNQANIGLFGGALQQGVGQLLGGLLGAGGEALKDALFGPSPDVALKEMTLEQARMKQQQELDARAQAEGWTPEQRASAGWQDGNKAYTADAQGLARAHGKQQTWVAAQGDPEVSNVDGKYHAAIRNQGQGEQLAAGGGAQGPGTQANDFKGQDQEAPPLYSVGMRAEGDAPVTPPVPVGAVEAAAAAAGMVTPEPGSYASQASEVQPVDTFQISNARTPGYLDQFLPKPVEEKLDRSKLSPIDIKRAEIKSKRLLGAITQMAMFDDPKLASDPKAVAMATSMLNTIGEDIDELIDIHNVSQGRESGMVKGLGGSFRLAADMSRLSTLTDATLNAMLTPEQQMQNQKEAQVILNRMQKLQPFELKSISDFASKPQIQPLLQHYTQLATNKTAMAKAQMDNRTDLQKEAIKAQVDMVGHQLTGIKIANEAKESVVKMHDIQFDNEMDKAKFEHDRAKDEITLRQTAERIGLEGEDNAIAMASAINTHSYQKIQARIDAYKIKTGKQGLTEAQSKMAALSQELKDLQAAKDANAQGGFEDKNRHENEKLIKSRVNAILKEQQALISQQAGAEAGGGAKEGATQTQASASEYIATILADPYFSPAEVSVPLWNVRFNSRVGPNGLEFTDNALRSNDGKGDVGPSGETLLASGLALAKNFDITRPVPTLEQFANLRTGAGQPAIGQTMNRRQLEQLHTIVVNGVNERKRLKK